MNEDAPISIPVPPQIAAAWQALPPERRASFARAIVAAWLEPLLLQGDRILSCPGEHYQQVVLVETT
jgi:hypothetical protein